MLIIIVVWALHSSKSTSTTQADHVPSLNNTPLTFCRQSTLHKQPLDKEPTPTPAKIITNITSHDQPSPQQVFEQNRSWLAERWQLANQEKETGQFNTFAQWFFEDAADDQLRRICNIGLQIKEDHISTGQAQDILGLYEPATDGQLEILRFYKVALHGMNKSRARHLIDLFRRDPDKHKKWLIRPASLWQKEYCNFFNLKTPKHLTAEKADDIIRQHQREDNEGEEDEEKLNDWESYQSFFEDFDDRELLNAYDIKKPSFSLLRTAINKLRNDGNNLSDISLDMIVYTLLVLKPDLNKGRSR